MNEKTTVLRREYKLYQTLLLLYPRLYRKKFGEEMLFLFDDLYKEQMQKEGKIGIIFWISLVLDTIKSAFLEHSDLAKKQGMKKYLRSTLQINKYNIIGGILLIPFFTVFLIDVVSRIIQGDLTRYNRPVYSFLSHTIFYRTQILFIWVILFPAVAVLINLIPLIQNIIKKHGSFLPFVKQNAVSLVILVIGLGFLAIIKLHDFAPCFVHGLLKVGILQLPHILSVCQNA